MGILELIIVLVTIAGLFLWNRAESRADIRHMDVRIDAIRELVHAIHVETKEFHNKLYEIEKKKE